MALVGWVQQVTGRLNNGTVAHVVTVDLSSICAGSTSLRWRANSRTQCLTPRDWREPVRPEVLPSVLPLMPAHLLRWRR
jgi:hypothetical protein